MDAEDDYQRWLNEWLGWDQTDADLAATPAHAERARQRPASGEQLPRFAVDEVAAGLT